MKIGFFGTPEMSAYYLNRLADFHEIDFAVTAEDKPRGRHSTPAPSPVKEAALKTNIPIFQPDNLLDEDFLNAIFNFKSDVYLVVAYAKMIPSVIFQNPRYRMINIHPSLLPKYRGAAPMQWALMNGERETGISIQYIDDGWDTGDVLLKKTIQAHKNLSFGELNDIVLPMGFDMVMEVLRQFEAGSANPVKQNDAEATYCGKLDRELAHIDWKNESKKIHDLVRGLNPKPVAWTRFKGRNIKIFRTGLPDNGIKQSYKLKPGHIAAFNKRLYAGTGSDLLEIFELQPESKKRMNAVSFINGYRIAKGDFFEND